MIMRFCYGKKPTKKIIRREKIVTALTFPVAGFLAGKIMHSTNKKVCKNPEVEEFKFSFPKL